MDQGYPLKKGGHKLVQADNVGDVVAKGKVEVDVDERLDVVREAVWLPEIVQR